MRVLDCPCCYIPAGAYGSDLSRYTAGGCCGSHGQVKAQAKETMCLGVQGVHEATSDTPVHHLSGKRCLTAIPISNADSFKFATCGPDHLHADSLHPGYSKP